MSQEERRPAHGLPRKTADADGTALQVEIDPKPGPELPLVIGFGGADYLPLIANWPLSLWLFGLETIRVSDLDRRTRECASSWAVETELILLQWDPA